jgi:hypothetical protein
VPKSASNTLPYFFDDFAEKNGVELWQVLKLDNRLRESLQFIRRDSFLYRGLIGLKNFDGFADKQNFLGELSRDVSTWKHTVPQSVIGTPFVFFVFILVSISVCEG